MSRAVLRQILLRATYGVFAIPCGLLVGMGVVWCYGFVFGIAPDANVYDIGLFHVLIGFALLIFGFLCGMSVGGWLWSRVARHSFRFSKAELEDFLITQGSPRFLNRRNQAAIDKLFGDKSAG